LAVANYESAKGHFPPAFVSGPDGKAWHSWRVLILPYIEGDAMFRQYRFEESWNGPNNSSLADRMPRIYAFHDTKFPTSTTNYVAVVGNETMWPGAEGRKRDDLTDGTANTILIVENNGLGIHWMEPRDLAFGTMNFRLDTPDGISSWYKDPAIVLVDGSVRRLSRGMSADALRAALTVDGGEKIGDGENGWVVLPDGRLREKK
jgi:hypothetical protein